MQIPEKGETKIVTLVIPVVKSRTGDRTVSPKTRQCPRACWGNLNSDFDKKCSSGFTRRGFRCNGQEIVTDPKKYPTS